MYRAQLTPYACEASPPLLLITGQRPPLQPWPVRHPPPPQPQPQAPSPLVPPWLGSPSRPCWPFLRLHPCLSSPCPCLCPCRRPYPCLRPCPWHSHQHSCRPPSLVAAAAAAPEAPTL